MTSRDRPEGEGDVRFASLSEARDWLDRLFLKLADPHQDECILTNDGLSDLVLNRLLGEPVREGRKLPVEGVDFSLQRHEMFRRQLAAADL